MNLLLQFIRQWRAAVASDGLWRAWRWRRMLWHLAKFETNRKD